MLVDDIELVNHFLLCFLLSKLLLLFLSKPGGLLAIRLLSFNLLFYTHISILIVHFFRLLTLACHQALPNTFLLRLFNLNRGGLSFFLALGAVIVGFVLFKLSEFVDFLLLFNDFI